MPTYEFRCPDGHVFEVFYRSIGSAESQAICPECGKAAERMMSAAGFAFKGSGFYLTDYGKNAHREKGTPEPKSGESSSKESSGDSSKSENSSASTDSSSSSTAKGESVKSAESPSSGSAEKKAESKPAESKPAQAPPKPGKSE